MRGEVRKPLADGRRRRARSFTLTPLVDVIFLLLMFFMLSSHFAPFGLLDVSAGAEAEDAAEDAPPAPRPFLASAGTATLRISRGHVGLDGHTVASAELPGMISGMRQAGITAVLVLTARSATVQDVVSALEMLKAGRFENVTLLSRPERG